MLKGSKFEVKQVNHFVDNNDQEQQTAFDILKFIQFQEIRRNSHSSKVQEISFAAQLRIEAKMPPFCRI